MKVLFSTRFADGRYPADWRVPTQHHSFESGALRSGRHTAFTVPVPGHGWRTLRVEMEVEIVPPGGAVLEFDNRDLSISVDLGRGMQGVYYYGGAALATGSCRPLPAGRYAAQFEIANGRWSAAVNGVEVTAADDPRRLPVLGVFEVGFWDDCRVNSIRIFGDQPLPTPAYPYVRRDRKDFFLEVNVDFPDDLMHAPFTAPMFDQMFAEFKRWGVRRCHWIYCGKAEEGWWDCSEFGAAENAARTVQNLGGEIFDAAVQASHLHGIAIYGMIKPFDMGFWNSFGEGTPAARTKGRITRVGGPVGWVTKFVAAHPELLMVRKPDAWGPGPAKPFTRIDLVKEDAEPAKFGVSDLRLYVSDDNITYRPYAGTIEREEEMEDYPVWEHTASGGRRTGQTRRSRVMRLNGLSIPHRFFALAVDNSRLSFANTFVNLIHVFSADGEERMLSYGVEARNNPVYSPDGVWATMTEPDFRTLGVEFDRFPGTPTACFPGYDAVRARQYFDGFRGFLAVARGKDRGTLAALSPSFPETRAWWLTWARDALAAGADGIELRTRNHHSPFAWGEFGFEPPVRDAFLKRYGVDLWKTDDFDHAAWRRLRGEAYTEFTRQVRRLCASYGKPLGAHIDHGMCMDPEQGAQMEIHGDWRAWLDEGLLNSVTMKELWPRTRFAEEVLSHARPKGTEMIFCPFANNLWKKPGGEKVVADWIRLAKEGDCDGYQFYECGCVVRGTKDGRVLMEQPALADVFRSHFTP